MGNIKITIKPNPRLHAQVKGAVAHIQNGTIQAEIKRLKEICASFPPVKILLNKKTK
jgi:hypothetical protein